VKPFARILLVLGLAAIGLFVFRQVPRDVTLVYGVPDSGAVQALDVDIRRGDATVRHAEFLFPGGAPAQVRHDVRLLDGDYTLALRLASAAGPVRVFTRAIAVSEGGTIVVPLGGGP
jgi:hypothetical protein